MENDDILDDFNSKPKTNYSKWSFKYFLLALLCFVFVGLEHRFFSSNSSEVIPDIVAILFCLFTILGLIKTVQSIKYKEETSFYKVIGMIGNIIFFILMIGAIGFISQELITLLF